MAMHIMVISVKMVINLDVIPEVAVLVDCSDVEVTIVVVFIAVVVVTVTVDVIVSVEVFADVSVGAAVVEVLVDVIAVVEVDSSFGFAAPLDQFGTPSVKFCDINDESFLLTISMVVSSIDNDKSGING